MSETNRKNKNENKNENNYYDQNKTRILRRISIEGKR